MPLMIRIFRLFVERWLASRALSGNQYPMIYRHISDETARPKARKASALMALWLALGLLFPSLAAGDHLHLGALNGKSIAATADDSGDWPADGAERIADPCLHCRVQNLADVAIIDAPDALRLSAAPRLKPLAPPSRTALPTPRLAVRQARAPPVEKSFLS